MRWSISFSLLSIFLSGCAVPLDTQFAKRDEQPVNRAPYAEESYVSLEAGNEITLHFSPEFASVREFQGERSYTNAVELPGSGIRQIEIRSYMNGAAYAKKSFLDPTNIGQYFHPVFMLLDDSYEELGTVFPNLQFVRGGLFEDRSDRLQGILILPPEARFLIVFTFPDLGVDAAQWQGVQGYSINAIPMAVTYGQRFEFQSAPEGRIRLLRSEN